jgi:hypothetical protein
LARQDNGQDLETTRARQHTVTSAIASLVQHAEMQQVNVGAAYDGAEQTTNEEVYSGLRFQSQSVIALPVARLRGQQVRQIVGVGSGDSA